MILKPNHTRRVGTTTRLIPCTLTDNAASSFSSVNFGTLVFRSLMMTQLCGGIIVEPIEKTPRQTVFDSARFSKLQNCSAEMCNAAFVYAWMRCVHECTTPWPQYSYLYAPACDSVGSAVRGMIFGSSSLCICVTRLCTQRLMCSHRHTHTNGNSAIARFLPNIT